MCMLYRAEEVLGGCQGGRIGRSMRMLGNEAAESLTTLSECDKIHIYSVNFCKKFNKMFQTAEVLIL